MAQTDHSFFADKVQLRVDHLPPGDISVLDCFAGRGLIWRAVQKTTGRKIKTLAIDTRDNFGFHLPGDNRRYLNNIDLSQFNVIDLDAYGIPYEQLRTVLDRDYCGTIFVTFIQSVWGGINYGLLEDIGFTREMIEKCPTIFNKDGWTYFKEWLALNGVQRIWHRSKSRKHYLGFKVGLN